MNHGHKKSADALVLRLNSLNRLDVWFPLVLEELGDPNVLYIWNAISVHLADFSGIVTAHDLWIYPNGKPRRWDIVISRWRLEVTPLTESHRDKKWINFHGESKNDISQFSRGVSNARLPSMFTLPSQKNPQGFSFAKSHNLTPACDIGGQKKRSRMHAELDLESTKTPMTPIESTPQSTLAAAAVSGHERSETVLSIFNKSTLSALLSGSLVLSYDDKKCLEQVLLSQAIPVKGTMLQQLPSANYRRPAVWLRVSSGLADDKKACALSRRQRLNSMEYLALDLEETPRLGQLFERAFRRDAPSSPCTGECALESSQALHRSLSENQSTLTLMLALELIA